MLGFNSIAAGMTLFAPNVTFVMIACLLPEPRNIGLREFQPAQPFRAFPEVNILQIISSGDRSADAAQRRAMLKADRLPS